MGGVQTGIDFFLPATDGRENSIKATNLLYQKVGVSQKEVL